MTDTDKIRIIPSRKHGIPVLFKRHYRGTDSSGSEGVFIEGYASTKTLDRQGDIVEPTAFKGATAEFMANPVLSYMHDWSNPIGKVTATRVTTDGLWVRAYISKTAETIIELVKEGILKGFSIGYDVVREEMRKGVNHILALKLYEVAIVSIPANPETLFNLSKALRDGASAAQIKALYLDERKRAKEANTIRIIESPKIRIIDGPAPKMIRVVSS